MSTVAQACAGVGPRIAKAPRSPTRAWWVALLALLLDVAVCVPFIVDPYGWRGATQAPAATLGRQEFVVFVAGPPEAPLRYVAAHPELRVEHTGGWGGTLVLSLPAGREDLLSDLSGQPFVRLLSRGGAVFCRAT